MVSFKGYTNSENLLHDISEAWERNNNDPLACPECEGVNTFREDNGTSKCRDCSASHEHELPDFAV